MKLASIPSAIAFLCVIAVSLLPGVVLVMNLILSEAVDCGTIAPLTCLEWDGYGRPFHQCVAEEFECCLDDPVIGGCRRC